jgi:hypothetical protein
MNGLILRYYCKDEGNKIIRELRSESGHYYVSIPGTIAMVRNGLVGWWTLEYET